MYVYTDAEKGANGEALPIPSAVAAPSFISSLISSSSASPGAVVARDETTSPPNNVISPNGGDSPSAGACNCDNQRQEGDSQPSSRVSLDSARSPFVPNQALFNDASSIIFLITPTYTRPTQVSADGQSF